MRRSAAKDGALLDIISYQEPSENELRQEVIAPAFLHSG
jgi:hypothetical protein